MHKPDVLIWWLIDYFELAMLLGSCFLVNYVTADAKTNWVEVSSQIQIVSEIAAKHHGRDWSWLCSTWWSWVISSWPRWPYWLCGFIRLPVLGSIPANQNWPLCLHALEVLPMPSWMEVESTDQWWSIAFAGTGRFDLTCVETVTLSFSTLLLFVVNAHIIMDLCIYITNTLHEYHELSFFTLGRFWRWWRYSCYDLSFPVSHYLWGRFFVTKVWKRATCVWQIKQWYMKYSVGDIDSLNSQAFFTNRPARCQNKFSISSSAFPQISRTSQTSILSIQRWVGLSKRHPSKARDQMGVQNLCHQATSSLGLKTCS